MQLAFIQTKIYEARQQKVMLDFDLSELYEVETKRLNEQVKRNIERFPSDFMFQLSTKEWEGIWSQNAISEEEMNRSQIATGSQKHRNKAVLPYAFTEHGVTMLASVLKSEKAVKMSIAVVRAFIILKQIPIRHRDLFEQLQELRQELFQRIEEHDVQLSQIYDAIENLLDEKVQQKSWKERERIGFIK